MTGELLALGANHKTAPLPLREKLALPDGRASRVMAELVDHEAIHEAVAISTCNRTELYLVTADPVEAETEALGILSRQAGLRPTELLGTIYSLRGRRGGRAPVLGHRRARLDDRRRGGGPGSGEALVRAGARRGRDRPGVQPALPRRAGRRQASAQRDRDRALERVGVVGRRAAGGGLPRRACRPERGRDRRRRERGAHGPAAVANAAWRRCSWPTGAWSGRSRWPSATAAAPCPSTSSRASSRARTSWWRRPAPRTRSWAARSSSRWPARGRDDRSRCSTSRCRATSTPARATARASRSTTWTTSSRPWHAT